MVFNAEPLGMSLCIMALILFAINQHNLQEEEYNKNVEDPREWAKRTVNFFNETLRPDEKPREFVDGIVPGSRNDKHEWAKWTHGMSVCFRDTLVDLMYCKRCGITGKRYRMSSHVKIDSKYRKKAFRKCSTAREELKRNPERYS